MKEATMRHKYAVGQLVQTVGAYAASRASGIYEVVRLMPESNGEFGYRIKDTASGTERAAGESEIRATGAGEKRFGVPAR
jgi:hypothetical protein